MHNETWWGIFTDPNHIKAELLWNLIQDGLIIFLLWGKVFKKLMTKVTHHVHREIDEAHGYEHIHECCDHIYDSYCDCCIGECENNNE